MGASGRNEASCRVGALGDHVVAKSASQIHQTEIEKPPWPEDGLKGPLALDWTQTLDFFTAPSFVCPDSEEREGEQGRQMNKCLLPSSSHSPRRSFPSTWLLSQIWYHLLLWLISGWERKLFWKFNRNVSLHIYECFSPLPCLWMTRVLLFLLTACWDRYFPFKQGLLLAARDRGFKPGILF